MTKKLIALLFAAVIGCSAAQIRTFVGIQDMQTLRLIGVPVTDTSNRYLLEVFIGTENEEVSSYMVEVHYTANDQSDYQRLSVKSSGHGLFSGGTPNVISFRLGNSQPTLDSITIETRRSDGSVIVVQTLTGDDFKHPLNIIE